MLIYCALIVMLLIFTYIEKKRIFDRKIIAFLYIFATIIIGFVAAFRSNSVGVDTFMYYDSYRYYLADGWNFTLRFEKGFSIFMKLLTYISNDPQIVIIASSFFITTSVSIFCYRFSPKPFFSLFLYVVLGYFMSYMNIMREAMAISTILIGFGFAKKKGFFNFLIFEAVVFLAMSFHFAAIFAAIIPFLKYIKQTKYSIILESIIVIFAFFFTKDIFNLMTSITGKYSYYGEGQFSVSNYYGALINALFGIFVVGIFLYANRKELISYNNKFIKTVEDDCSKENSFYLSIGIIYVFALILTIQMNIFNRFSNVYAIYNIILIPIAFTKMQAQKYDLLKFFVILIFLLYFFIIAIFRPEWNGCIPYKFCF